MSTEMNPTTGLRLDLLGPTVEFLTSPHEAGIDFCVLKGVIPPGVSVPLHSHPDTEDFFVISGEVQALRQSAQGYEWIEAKTRDYLHVPGRTRHGWRNVSSASGRIHHHDQKTGPIPSGGGKTDYSYT
jgi:quercetin dioxygenase-like cupin family protein